VQCIWAGTVELEVKLVQVGSSNASSTVLTLGSPVSFADKQVSLERVEPAPNSKTKILPGDYIFFFAVR
jgi:hypothetical protein